MGGRHGTGARGRGMYLRGLAACAGVALGLAASAPSCGGTALDSGFLSDSNTNWVRRCGPLAPCPGALSCLCGMCSQPCAETNECARLEGARCGSSCGESPSVAGGMCVLSCATSDDCGAGFACQSGECRAAPSEEESLGDASRPSGGACANPFVSFDSLYAAAYADSLAQDAADAPFQRYVSMANRWNAGACPEELEIERKALSEALNGASTSPTLSHPEPIDSDRLLYRIDIRDYGWDRPIRVSGEGHADGWAAAVSETAFAAEFTGPEADALKARASTAVPLIQSDALVAAIMTGELYMSLVDLPGSLGELYASLGVDRAADEGVSGRLRAGTTQSRAAIAPVIIERNSLPVRRGMVWTAFNLPIEGDLFESALAVPFAGGEVIFSLPNGLPAFAIFDAGGRLGPESDLLLDTAQNDFRARAAVSCLGCHVTPILPVVDEVRARLELDLGSYTAQERARLLALYVPAPDALAVMSDDADAFREARAMLDLETNVSDPVAQLWVRFDRDLQAPDLEGDLMAPPGSIGVGGPAAIVSVPGLVDRDDFALQWLPALCEVHAASRNRPWACGARR